MAGQVKVGPERPPTAEEQAFVDAAGRGNSAAVNAAMTAGMDPNTVARRGSEWNVTALMAAAEKGRDDIVRALVDAGADPNLFNSDVPFGEGNYTALQMALLGKCWESARILIGAGAKLTSKSGRPSPLETAVSARQHDLVRMLLDKGANPNKKGIMGQTPLHEAANKGDRELVEWLLSAGANVSIADEVGGTPLSDAARKGHTEVARRLIEAGADVNTVKKAAFRGATPLMLAAAFGQDEMVGLLLEAGSNPNATEPDGMTALDFAIDQGHAAVAERLWAAGAVSGKHGPAAEPQRIPRGIDRPDFSDGSRDPGFQESALRLSEICGTPAEPFDELGGVTCVVPKGRASEIVDAHRQEFLHRGCFLFHTRAASFARANPCQIVLLPTTDQFAAIALLQTNGINYDLGPGDIIDALKEIDREWPLILTEVSHDLVSGRFMEPLGNTPALARRLYELCPDIVDQGTESLSALAAALKQSPDLFLWWD